MNKVGRIVVVLVLLLNANGTRTRKPMTSISRDQTLIGAMFIEVGSSTSTASRSTIRTTSPCHERLCSYPMLFAKHKLRVFPHLIPRHLFLPGEEKGSNDFMGFWSSLLLCVSQRSPRTATEGHATGLLQSRVTELLRSCVTELSWLPFARLGGSKGRGR